MKKPNGEQPSPQNEGSRRNAVTETEQSDQEMDEDTVVNIDSGHETDPALTNVSRMAISADGQWLATTDDLSRTYVFNLDSVQVRLSHLIR